MPEYSTGISAPNLGGLTAPSRPIAQTSDTAAFAQVLGQALGLGAQAYGRKKAQAAGKEIGGEGESFTQAEDVAGKAAAEFQSIFKQKEEAQGGDVTEGQVADLKKQVFDKVLTNQKRIQAALRSGAITSTEANARINVLRNEALSNPLVAPFQDELDNALFVTTGGAGTTFAKTAAEVEAATVKKAQLEALEATEKQVTSMLLTKVAGSRQQALNIIAQQQQHQANMAFYEEKKARLGVTSQEAYAASQTLVTAQSSSAYGTIAQWVQQGGDAKQVAPIRMKLVQEGEQIKQSIMKSARGSNGELLVSEDTLRAQINEVDKRTEAFSAMLDDQTATKTMIDVMAQRQAVLDTKNQSIQIELSNAIPVFMAMKDNPVASEWLWNNAVNMDQMLTKWQEESNPLLKTIGKLSPEQASKTVMETNEKVVMGKPLETSDREIAAQMLVQRGGTAAVDEAFKKNPEQTIKMLSETPFRTRDIYNSREWIKKASTDEGREQVNAVIEGASSRAILSSMSDAARPKGGKFKAPDSVKVTKNKPVLTNKNTMVQRQEESWSIDTGGIYVNDQYKSEIINAYKLGTEVPSLWDDKYDSIDLWINDLFTRGE
jgi:hypothetical protein